jgi:hypothetical protein
MSRLLARRAATALASVQPEPVDNLGSVLVGAGDEHPGTTGFQQAPTAAIRISRSAEGPGLGEVRYQQGAAAEQILAQLVEQCGIGHLLACAGSQHWVHHERELGVLGGQITHHPHRMRASEQPNLDRADPAVAEDQAALLRDLVSGLRRELSNSTGVLGGDAGDNAAGVEPSGSCCLRIRLNTRTTTRVLAADGQEHGRPVA